MCVKTLSAWKVGKKPNGKDNISFNPPAHGKGEFIQLPCGQCIECRLERSRQWAMRCMHEASLYQDNCFITLTFNDYHVDPKLSLVKSDFQLFMKRLRKHLDNYYWDPDLSSWIKLKIPFSLMCSEKYSGLDEVVQKVRYFHCGEYGEEFGRPHHHAILFNFDFPDKKCVRVTKQGHRMYESELLNKLWSDPDTGESLGFHEISNVSFETCAYVARYVVKKVYGDSADEHYTMMDEQGNFWLREPEYCTMSRNSGIGLDWFEKYKDTDVFPHDRVVIRDGIECKPPRYYGNKYELTNPQEFAICKEIRLKKMKESAEGHWDRQRAREQIKKSQSQFLKRSLL